MGAATRRLRGGPWWLLLLLLLVASVCAVAVRAAGYPESVPGAVAGFLDWFVDPGVALWWLTTPNLFMSFSSSPLGYAIVTFGNTALWMIAAAIGVYVCKVSYRGLQRLRG